MGLFDKLISSVKDSFSKGDAGVADGVLGLFKGKPKGEATDAEPAEAGGEETESGFGDIAKSFKSKGYGDVLSSWVGKGKNKEISEDQLEEVLGEEKVKHLSEKTGLDKEALLGKLKNVFPTLVDKMTPDGEVPDEWGAEEK